MLNLQRILGSDRARVGLGVAGLAVVLSLSACGQRGPLYLPTEPAAAETTTVSPSFGLPTSSRPK